MNKTLRIGLIALWVLVATGFLARLLLTELRIQANLPESFWLWLGDLFGIQDAEGQVALEVWLGLGFAFVVVCLLTLIGYSLWQRIKAQGQAND